MNLRPGIRENPMSALWVLGAEVLKNGLPDRNRTCDPQLRRLLLYPTELRAVKTQKALDGAFIVESTVSMRWLDIEKMVGAAGFELATLCSQSRCATRLRYAPTSHILTSKRRFFVSCVAKI
jgi:hypothetical protein